jgi:Zn-dependent peptidase ImmA (M78 family)
MEFEINGMKWLIKKHSAKDLLEHYKKNNNDDITYLFGYTDFTQHEVCINEECCFDQQCMTLAHELTHCWIFNSGLYYADGFMIETVCEIVSNCHRFVHDTVERYKKEMK